MAQLVHLNKRIYLHLKTVQLPEEWSVKLLWPAFYPLSHNIHTQMLQTDLHPLPEKKNGGENLLPRVTTGLLSNRLP